MNLELLRKHVTHKVRRNGGRWLSAPRWGVVAIALLMSACTGAPDNAQSSSESVVSSTSSLSGASSSQVEVSNSVVSSSSRAAIVVPDEPVTLSESIEAEQFDAASVVAPFERQEEGNRTVMVWPNDGTNGNNMEASDDADGQLFYSVVATSPSMTIYATVNAVDGTDDSFYYKLEGADSAWTTQNGTSTNGYEELQLLMWSGLEVGKTYIFKVQRREDGMKLDSFRAEGGAFSHNSTGINAYFTYQEQCAICHGDENGVDAGSAGPIILAECASCSDVNTLANFIDIAMPSNNTQLCTGDCAAQLAVYIMKNFPAFAKARQPDPGKEFSCNPAVASDKENVIRRLTREDFARTIRGITGVDVSALAQTIPDLAPIDRSFNNNAVEVGVLSRHVNRFYDLADEIAPLIQGWLNGELTCSDYGASCESEVIRNLALQLYRAPAVDSEIEALRGVFAVAESESLSFQQAASYVLRAMLQAPRFIYRIERETGDGSVRPLSSYELASRMSYAVWGAAPDAALLAAAATGSNAQVLNQLDRLLADPRAVDYGVQFLSDWFDLHRMAAASADAERFAGFDNALFADMEAETEATFRHVVENDLPLMSIYNLQITWVSQALAQHYGLDNPQSGIREYDLSANAQRGGILTQGAVSHIGGDESSTVRRGLFMLNQVLCSRMASPPASAPTEPIPPKEGQSIRDVSELRVSDPTCGICHSQFEPMVWGLVPLDMVGKFHLTDEHNNDLPADGYVMIPGEGRRDYSGPTELGDILAQSQRAEDCALLKSFEFTMARAATTADSCSLEAAREAMVASDGSYRDLLRAIIRSEKFSHIRTEQN